MKIAIIHNLPNKTLNSKKTISDDEALEIAQKIKNILASKADIYKFESSIVPKLKEYDVVFNIAERTYESKYKEYEIVKILEDNGIPFTGSGSKAIEITSYKDKIKKILIDSKITTPNYAVTDSPSEVRLKFPLIVKPVNEHGSIGITKDSIVKNQKELIERVAEIKIKLNQKSLIEEYIDGREINAAILDNEVLPLSEILFNFPKDEPKILTYDTKWDSDSFGYNNTVGICPANLTKEMEEKLKKISLEVFSAFSCSGYTRVDFRIKDNVPYVIDVNPNPCINDDAGFFRSANAKGYSYKDTIMKIINAAIQNSNKKMTIGVNI